MRVTGDERRFEGDKEAKSVSVCSRMRPVHLTSEIAWQGVEDAKLEHKIRINEGGRVLEESPRQMSQVEKCIKRIDTGRARVPLADQTGR